jgi:hypothetical protein
MRRGTQPDDLRSQGDESIVAVMHDMVERYVDRHFIWISGEDGQVYSTPAPARFSLPASSIVS